MWCWAKSGPTRCYPPTPPPLVSFLVSVGDAWWRAIHSGVESRSGAPLPPGPDHTQLGGRRDKQHRRIDVCMWVGMGGRNSHAHHRNCLLRVAFTAHCCASSSTRQLYKKTTLLPPPAAAELYCPHRCAAAPLCNRARFAARPPAARPLIVNLI